MRDVEGTNTHTRHVAKVIFHACLPAYLASHARGGGHEGARDAHDDCGHEGEKGEGNPHL